MKTKLDHLIIALAILAISGGGAAPEARADGWGDGQMQIRGEVANDPTVYFQSDLSTNSASFGTFDNWHWTGYLRSSGSYAYADLERFIAGGYVYHTMHIAGAAIYSGYPEFGVADSSAGIVVTEWMQIQYLPDSETDTPPTSVSFQVSYAVQGQMQLENDNWSIGAQPGGWGTGGNTGNPLGITLPISANIVGGVIRQQLNQGFTIENAFNTGVNWGGYFHFPNNYNQPATYDLRYVFQGFVNIVDQNGQPIPANKLIFWCVNSNDTTQQVPFASQPDLAIEQAITLTAIPGTGSLTLQWPSYASSYQLQTTPGLGNTAWNTNGLPAPVVVGPFLQVTVPATNAAAFFRLLQTN